MHIVVRSALPAVIALVFASSAPAASDPAPAAPAGGIGLDVRLGFDPTEGACGTDTTLQATRGDQVNFCYVVTNNSSTPLNWQTLADDVNGPIFTTQPITLAPGASYQYNRIVVATDSQAPSTTWTAYDVHPDYVFTDTVASQDVIFAFGFDQPVAWYNFIDISATGTSLLLNDDDYAVADIGFPFTFYGQTASTLTVSNNGGILFDQAGTHGRNDYLSPINRALPDHRIGLAMLPWWDDIQQDYIDGVGNVFVQTLGEAPNRQFVIEWYNLPISFGGGTTVTFEAVLYEGSNYIQFEYANVDCGSAVCDDGASATIGVNADAITSTQYSFDQATLAPNKAILFTPSDPTTYSATQQVTLDVGAPVIGVDPASFDKTLAAGGSTTDTLTISNSGNRDLTWNIGEVAARAHFPPVSRIALPMGDPDLSDVGPRPLPVGAKPTEARYGVPFAADGVPAVANDVSTSLLVNLDVTQPATLSTIASIDGLQFLAGDFAGEDFTTLYAIDYRSFILYKVDTATGALTPIDITEVPAPASADAWNGMSWDATTGTMYAVTSGGGRTKQSWLFKLDLQHAVATLVAEITGVGDPEGDGTAIIDIAVDSNGLLYGVDIITDTLVAIDKNSGEGSTIGSIGFDANFNADLDFDDYTGTLYFAAYDNNNGVEGMYTLDTETGEATAISPIGADPTTVSLDAMGIARLGGVCAYPNDVPWLSYSAGRGSTAPGDTTPITVTFDATDLAAGTYSADICIYNNDLTNKRLAVPVSLTVQ